MFKLFDNLKKKDDGFSPFASFFGLGSARWMSSGYLPYSTEGYNKNAVVYHCINRIAEAVCSIPYDVLIKGKEVENGPINVLLAKPNPFQAYKAFMHMWVLHRLISGNAYILGNKVSTGRVMGMELLRPDRVSIYGTIYQKPYQYNYALGTAQVFKVDPITGLSDILHSKNTNPVDDLYGLSPMASAAMSIDQHNEAGVWNKKLLQNGAKPPGIISMRDKGDNAAQITPEQMQDIAQQINDKFAGASNAGKIPVISYDMLWQNLGMSPADMDWLQGRNASARDICLAFNYPAQLLGLPEGATFNNVDAAKQSFFQDTVIPLAQELHAELSWWLSLHMNMDIEITQDLDDLPALAMQRDLQRTTNRNDCLAGIMTINEARNFLGLEFKEGGDDLLVPVGKLPLNFDSTSALPQSEADSMDAQDDTVD